MVLPGMYLIGLTGQIDPVSRYVQVLLLGTLPDQGLTNKPEWRDISSRPLAIIPPGAKPTNSNTCVHACSNKSLGYISAEPLLWVHFAIFHSNLA